MTRTLRDPDEANIPDNIKIEKKELDMALSIIDQLTGEFEPEKYKDTYKDELLKIITKKSKEKPGAKKTKEVEEKPKPKKGASDDLLEQLKASLEAIKN
ncbi:hypothetical protein [Flavobacterium sp. 3HN19-14]|uniref:hypothetical protein n=1 Tax=Flavobacterium sp. 3HN19-14 TaxID=3448133 RepID=UPI003EDECAB5